MSQSDESRWSKKWIINFKKQCSERGIYVKTVNTHGHIMQERGLSDYLICYEGKYIAMEFKKEGGRLTSYQDNFLQEIHCAGGVAIINWLTSTYFFLQREPYDAMGIQFYGKEKEALDKLLKVS